MRSRKAPPVPDDSLEMPADMSSISYESQGLKAGFKKFLNTSLVIIGLIAIFIFGKSFFFDTTHSDDLQNGLAESSEVSTPDKSNDTQNEQLSSVASAIATLDSLNSLFMEETDLSGGEDTPKANGSDPGEQVLNPSPAFNEDTLEPVSATVNIFVSSDNKPVAADIFLDDTFVGKTDENGLLTLYQLELEKTYTARASLQGYMDASQNITLSEETTEVALDINQKINTIGTLIVETNPAADSIFVDNVFYGSQTPFEKRFEQGQHQVRLVNSSLQKNWQKTVTITAGQVTNVNHNFGIVEVGKVAISLKNAFEFGFGYVYVDGKIWHDKHNTTPLEISLEAGPHRIEVRRDRIRCNTRRYHHRGEQK